MQLTYLVVGVSALAVKICFAGLINEMPKPDESVVKASIDILESCYTHRFGTVGLAGSSAGSIVKSISSRKTIVPVALIDESSRVERQGPVDRESRYKLQVFVITVTNSNTLAKTLKKVKNSKWWNHMASFLLIDPTAVENGCPNAYEMLWEAWKNDILNSKFMCLHRTRGKLIYTFNPYTSKAPGPWQRENTYKGINGHDWTLFVREYREEESRCDGIDFDKTLDLGGYEIRASVKGMENWWYADSSKQPTILNRMQNTTTVILMNSFNATWRLLLHPESSKELVRDKNGNPSSIAIEVINGSSDILFNVVMKLSWVKYETTYPHFQINIAVVTQYPGYKSQLDKILSVLDSSSRFCLLVVFLITGLFSKFWLRKPTTLAIMDLVLIICNAALPTIPKKLAPRLYLTSLFVLVITIQGIYQGQLSALLTIPVRLPSINSIEDLARSDHTIYGLRAFHPFLNQSEFKGRYVESVNFSCIGYVLRDAKAACVRDKLSLISEAAGNKLHLSRESIGVFGGAFLIRPDWPLIDRTNEIYRRVVASSLVKPMYIKELGSAINKLEAYENEDRELKVLTLGDLSFAFVILAIGIGCATITFIVEVAISGKSGARPQSRRIQRRIRMVE